MSTFNPLVSNLARSTSLNTTTQTGQASASVTAVALGPNARTGEPLQVLYITSAKDFPEEVDAMEESFSRHQLNAGILDLVDIEGADIDDRKKNLELHIAQLHKDRRLDDATLVILSMHGSEDNALEEQGASQEAVADDIQNSRSNHNAKKANYLLSVLDGALEVDFHWLIARIRNTVGDGIAYQGQIHLTACGAKRCMELVSGDGHSYVAYGGGKSVFTNDAQVTCLAVVDLLGRCHRDRTAFPAPEKIAEHAASVSGATVSVKTADQSIIFSALKSAPQPQVTNKAVAEALETKGARILQEKLAHGSAKAVKKTIEKFGEEIWAHLHDQSIFDVIESGRDVVNKLRLLDEHGWPLDDVNAEGDSLLHLAVEMRDETLIDFCIDAGLPINEKNRKGERPLYIAVSAESVDAVKRLIQAGANPNLYFLLASDSYTLFQVAVVFGNNEIIKSMLESPLLEINAGTGNQNKSALHLAAELDNSRAVGMLLAKGADLNIRDRDGDTPLHSAIRSGSTRAANALIASGADVNSANSEGVRPLMIAATKQNGHYLVSALLSRGAKINATDRSEDTALHYAAQAGNLQSVRVLLTAHADPSRVDQRGCTAEELAERFSQHSVATFLNKFRPVQPSPKRRL
jgi:ankyrin repeat protein